jgi:hypothetical protein
VAGILTQTGEAGNKNFAGKSEPRTSKSETTKNGKGEKKQFGHGGLSCFRVRIFALFEDTFSLSL